ncbi:MAG: pyridoxal 5'-phosphate synthase glutaminase subunit PdxT [Thermoplasmata archaeon]|nr:pyridoxal 5'-phosphate synthase glutaminase subunit PdxT [Thermoplasmata archaeon]
MTLVGVLAVQGAFVEHEASLSRLGAECYEIRKAADLGRSPDALVIPGGESTVMGKLTRDLGMLDRLRGLIEDGTPVLGTCAGMILLARGVEGGITHLGTMPITVRRNAYGRQLGSFSAVSDFAGLGEIPLEFIRAPAVVSVGEGVETLAEVDGVPVAVRYGNQLVTAFHPELTDDLTVHRFLLGLIQRRIAF